MDRLVELFIQSARYSADGDPSSLSAAPVDGGRLDAEGIERGVTAMEQMLSSEDGLKMGANPAGTFVCLAMALEEKPLLQAASSRCYEKSLEYLDKRKKMRGETAGSWEKAVVLQQLGAVCLRQSRASEAARWLSLCAEECTQAEGHPSEAVLFDGNFNTQQTRLEFGATVEKLCAKLYHELGDEAKSRKHYENLQRLSRLQSSDAVERAVAKSEMEAQKAGGGSSQKASQAATPVAAVNDPKALWSVSEVEERRTSEYRYSDEGATVSILLELNEHLGIGEEASAAVESLQQFRVNCEKEKVDVKVRMKRSDGKVWQFQLLLDPLVHAIIPEDTVPRLKGREGKRRLEIKLFKADKKIEWRGELVKQSSKDKKVDKAAMSAKAMGTKGTQLNPLTPEELARLPRPSGAGGDNRPSSWQSDPILLSKEPSGSDKKTPTPTAVSVGDGALAEMELDCMD